MAKNRNSERLRLRSSGNGEKREATRRLAPDRLRHIRPVLIRQKLRHRLAPGRHQDTHPAKLGPGTVVNIQGPTLDEPVDHPIHRPVHPHRLGQAEMQLPQRSPAARGQDHRRTVQGREFQDMPQTIVITRWNIIIKPDPTDR